MKYVRQTQGDSAIQTMQDVCLVCGCYMPEGTGMICPNCMSDENKPIFNT